MSASQRRDLFLATFAILALELAIIRWMSQQVRLFAYLNNVLLIAAFLGMGLGVGKRRAALLHWALPILAVLCAILAPQVSSPASRLAMRSKRGRGYANERSRPCRLRGCE